MSLVEARQLVWGEIIAEVKQHWELLVLINDKKIAIHEFKAQLEVGHREGEEKASIAKKYVRYLNELSPEELRTQGVIDHFRTVIDVTKMIEKENAHVNTLGFLALVSKGVEKFYQEWHKLVEAGLPPCWDPQSGALFPLMTYD